MRSLLIASALTIVGCGAESEMLDCGDFNYDYWSASQLVGLEVELESVPTEAKRVAQMCLEANPIDLEWVEEDLELVRAYQNGSNRALRFMGVQSAHIDIIVFLNEKNQVVASRRPAY